MEGYLDKKIEETEELLIKCTNDKKYYSLERMLAFLKSERDG
ncbi:MAG: hypothetical protein AAGC43_04520 [Bacteroidota bacterium]